MARANYISRVIDTAEGQYIAVVDLFSESNPTMSVTNDAEAVVEEVIHAHGNLPIVYRDTSQDWDAILHDGQKFVDFSPHISDPVRQAIEREF